MSMRMAGWRQQAFMVSCALAACQRSGMRADPARIPPGHGWYASTIDFGTCTRSCETRPGAMTSSHTAPVADCGPVKTAYCYTFSGPENAGLPVRCLCDRETCERNRKSIVTTDYGRPISNVSECTEEL